MERTIYKTDGVSLVSKKPVTNLDEFFRTAVGSTFRVNQEKRGVAARMLQEARAKNQPMNQVAEMERRELEFHKNMLRLKEKEALPLPVLGGGKYLMQTNYEFWQVQRDIEDTSRATSGSESS